GGARRILVLDLDVHQGDGTARIFAGDPRVFTLSLHGANNYPAEKASSDLDVALSDGTEDAAYLAALDAALERMEDERFDLIFYNAGVDVTAADRLGRLALSPGGLRARDARAIGWAARRGVPLAAALGGGYGSDPDEVASRHQVLFEEAARRWEARSWTGFSAGSPPSSPPKAKPRLKARTRSASRSPR
ncbi:MAG: hypothetical protein AAGF90_07085, partial [Pseudomonadota bacterium]